MIPVLKSRDISSLFPVRAPDSHKGMNGKVMIVGGSIDFFGAPILSGLGALNSGCDLVHLFVPECNFEVTRNHSPNFIVHRFPGEYLDIKAINSILDFSKNCDAILLGPGLGKRPETLEALSQIIPQLGIFTLLDSEAIQVFQNLKELPLRQKVIITPHHHEFEQLTGKNIKISTALSAKIVLVRTLATDLKINILLKGPDDFIASEDGDVVMNSTGNAGMTVGGSGDVLSGFITSMVAQGASPLAALKLCAYVYGKTGDILFKQKGYCFTATDLAFELPYVIKELSS